MVIIHVQRKKKFQVHIAWLRQKYEVGLFGEPGDEMEVYPFPW